ncbi:MAG: hypothetical protein M5U26_10050 [Planctomycetota bacterium]|nr:hypothetical protein [Planctomycetota bacterium]
MAQEAKAKPTNQFGPKPNNTIAIIGAVLLLVGLGWMIFNIITAPPEEKPKPGGHGLPSH